MELQIAEESRILREQTRGAPIFPAKLWNPRSAAAAVEPNHDLSPVVKLVHSMPTPALDFEAVVFNMGCEIGIKDQPADIL